MEAVVSPAAAGSNGTNGTNGTNGVASTPFAAVDPVRVVDHLTVLLQAALGATRTELEAPGSLLSTARYPDTLQRCTRFALDAQVSLYIQKDLAPSAEPLDDVISEEGKDIWNFLDFFSWEAKQMRNLTHLSS